MTDTSSKSNITPEDIATDNLRILAIRRFPQIKPDSIRFSYEKPLEMFGDARDGGSHTLIHFELKEGINTPPMVVTNSFRLALEEFAGLCTGEKTEKGTAYNSDRAYFIRSHAPIIEIASKSQKFLRGYKEPNTHVSLLTISDKMIALIEKGLGINLRNEKGEKIYSMRTNTDHTRFDIEIPTAKSVTAASLNALVQQLKNETFCDCEIKQKDQKIVIRFDGTLPREYVHGMVEEARDIVLE